MIAIYVNTYFYGSNFYNACFAKKVFVLISNVDKKISGSDLKWIWQTPGTVSYVQDKLSYRKKVAWRRAFASKLNTNLNKKHDSSLVYITKNFSSVSCLKFTQILIDY